MLLLLGLFYLTLLLKPWSACGQFPAACNNPENLQSKTCCPNNCGGPTGGSCENITAQVVAQWELADPVITAVLKNTPNGPQKGTADARYLWPTVVFEKVCVCKEHFWGGDCTQCNFGWTGNECNTRKTPVVRKSFDQLATEEKQAYINAIRDLKNEKWYQSVVIVEEPKNYTSGIVTLQNISAYDFLMYLHHYAARDAMESCTAYNNAMVDFAHIGPVFPMWHRYFLLLFEREIQRIMNNASFGLPYWPWQEDSTSPFTPEYFGVPASVIGPAVNVTGKLINPDDWNTACDIAYRLPGLSCSEHWRVCNPAEDLAAHRPLQRGDPPPVDIYLPNTVEVQIALAASSYDAVDRFGKYSFISPRKSFRSRLEGGSAICSAAHCVYPEPPLDSTTARMHNIPHMWVGGHMIWGVTSVNDPIFYLHHSNIDRILESWFHRFANGSSNPALLPGYIPVSGGHPGHNRDDYMVPFFPLVTPVQEYCIAENLGYKYDELISANIQDFNIPDCNEVVPNGTCPICDANGTCINCISETCPAPGLRTISLVANSKVDSRTPISEAQLGLELGLGLGIPLLIAMVAVISLAFMLIAYRYFPSAISYYILKGHQQNIED